jgi:hypothetical protein
MKHDQGQLEGYAVKALEMTEPIPPTQWLGIEAVGAALGLTADESKHLAGEMKGEGWAKLDYGMNPPKLELTYAGRKAIEELRLSKFRRWINNNPGLWVTILAPILSILSAILVKLLERWLGLK